MFTYSLTFITYSLTFITYSLTFITYSLTFITYSLTFITCTTGSSNHSFEVDSDEPLTEGKNRYRYLHFGMKISLANSPLRNHIFPFSFQELLPFGENIAVSHEK